MSKLLLSLPILLVLAGCSGEPAPTVGDAPIAKGIERRPMPQPTSPRATEAAAKYTEAKGRFRAGSSASR